MIQHLIQHLLESITWVLPLAVALVALTIAEVRPFWLAWWYESLLFIEVWIGEWATKPIGGCAKCTAGFWCLVASIAYDPSRILAHLVSASLAILIGAILTKIYQWTQN
jgi:hypothetical protein